MFHVDSVICGVLTENRVYVVLFISIVLSYLFLTRISEYNVDDMNDPVAGQVVRLYDITHRQVTGDSHLFQIFLICQ